MTAPAASVVNRRVAELLRQYAALLEQQEASPFRVNAYRRAAETVDSLDVDLGELVSRAGPDGLLALPHIGRGIAAAIQEILRTGRFARVDQLRGELEGVEGTAFLQKPFEFDDLLARIRELVAAPSLRRPAAGPLRRRG